MGGMGTPQQMGDMQPQLSGMQQQMGAQPGMQLGMQPQMGGMGQVGRFAPR